MMFTTIMHVSMHGFSVQPETASDRLIQNTKHDLKCVAIFCFAARFVNV